MVRKGVTAEQIINKLREVEILLSQGSTIGVASKKIGVTEQTYYRWRKEYGGMRIDGKVSQGTRGEHPAEKAGGRSFPG